MPDFPSSDGPHDEASLIDEVREALDDGQPLDLLGLVSMVILATDPPLIRTPADRPSRLAELVDAFIGTPGRETTALLSVLGALLIDDEPLRVQCRRAAEARRERLPGWLADLNRTTVRRAVRMTDSSGDGEELLLGVRFSDGQELTCAVTIDHRSRSSIQDAFFVPAPLERVLSVAQANNTDPDTTFDDADLADAAATLQSALAHNWIGSPPEGSDTWPSCRALVQWLASLAPQSVL
jgi:hypothetical protein